MWLIRHWKAGLGILWFIPPILKAAWETLGVAGNVDFVVTHAQDLGWVGQVIAWLLNPPGWSVFPMILVGLGLIWWDNKRTVSRKQGALDQVAPTERPQSTTGAGFTSRVLTAKQLTEATGYFIVPENIFTIKISLYGAGGGGSEGQMAAGFNGGSTSMAKCSVTGGYGGRTDNQRAEEGRPFGAEIGRAGGGARGGEGCPDIARRLGSTGANGGFGSVVRHVSPGDKMAYIAGRGGAGAGKAQKGEDGYIVVEY